MAIYSFDSICASAAMESWVFWGLESTICYKMIYSVAFLFVQDAPPEKHNGFSFSRQSCWHQWEMKKKHKYEMNLMLPQNENGMQCLSDLINAQCRLGGLEYFNS